MPSVLEVGASISCVLDQRDSRPHCWDEEGRADSPDVPLSLLSVASHFACGITQADGTPVCWLRPDPPTEDGQPIYQSVVDNTPTSSGWTDLCAGKWYVVCGLRDDTPGIAGCWRADHVEPFMIAVTEEHPREGDFSVIEMDAAAGACAKYTGTDLWACWGWTLTSDPGRAGYVPEGEEMVTWDFNGGQGCGLRPDNTVACVEEAADNHLQYFPADQQWDMVSLDDYLCGLSREGEITCVDQDGVVDTSAFDEEYLAVDTESSKVCALSVDRQVRCNRPEYEPPWQQDR